MGISRTLPLATRLINVGEIDTLLISLPIVLAGIFCLYHTRRYLDLLTFGEETASTMGVDPNVAFSSAPLA